MGLVVTILGLGIFCLALWEFCQHLPPDQVPALRRWFRNWMIKGLLTPFLLWMLFNSAVFDWFPPLMPAVQRAKMTGHWTEMLLHVATLGLFVTSTYWAALTLAWLLVTLWLQSDEPRQFGRRALVWSASLVWAALLGPLAILITWSFGWQFAGLAMALWLLPVFQRVMASQPEPKVAPLYNRAIAAIQFDKFEDAEKAVIEELESCENDFDGWMLLAQLYAVHFSDLPGAQELIREICQHPATTPSQFSVACHRLADWQLKHGQDPDAARAALAEICQRFPRSHLDHMARLRIRQLPATREEWIAAHGVKKIRLPVLGSALAESVSTVMSRETALARSQECVKSLQTNPDDVPARETLAQLWAVELGQINLAVEQLELLLAMPGTTAAQAAQWLALMASWHLRFPPNLSAARKVLERLIQLYPDSPQAFAARCRLNVMDLEAKMRNQSTNR